MRKLKCWSVITTEWSQKVSVKYAHS